MKKRDQKELSRRAALGGVGAVIGGSALGCTVEDGAFDGAGGAAGQAGAGQGGQAGSGQGGAGGAPPSTPDELLAGIDHFVVVMMENRSFDHYLGSLQLDEGRDIDGLTGAESNDDRAGNSYPVAKEDDFVVLTDPPHGYQTSRDQHNGGANDKFVEVYEDDGATEDELSHVMNYHFRDQLPVLYALADESVLCNRWFSSVMGPTQPNRYYFQLGTSEGSRNNDPIRPSGLTLYHALEEAGVSNTYYFSSLPEVLLFGGVPNMGSLNEFFEDAQAGSLPSFCVVDPTYTFAGTIGNDDHPPADVREGQAYIASIYEALAQSPHWERTLLIVTYDEHGGFYDHVAPPVVPEEERPDFQQLGFRVPSLVVGPQVKRGGLLSDQLEHVSIAATMATRFGIDPLNARVAAANDLSGAIDPAATRAPRPPVTLPPVELPPQMRIEAPRGYRVDGQIALAQFVQEKKPHWDLQRMHRSGLEAVRRHGQRLGRIRLRG